MTKVSSSPLKKAALTSSESMKSVELKATRPGSKSESKAVVKKEPSTKPAKTGASVIKVVKGKEDKKTMARPKKEKETKKEAEASATPAADFRKAKKAKKEALEKKIQETVVKKPVKSMAVGKATEGRFELVSPYGPAGDQPAAIEGILEGLEKGFKNQTILGVTGSGKTFTLANIIEKSQRPALIMAPNKTLAAQLYAEFRDFFPKNAVEYFVSYYDYYQPEAYVPSKDLFIEKDSAINEHIEQMRLSATKALLERRDVIIVSSVSAIYGLGNPESYHEMILSLRKNAKLARKEIISRLVAMQYERSETDFQRGTFRVKGDVIDIFPSEHSKDALRIELFDDEIEKLSLLDALTGKTIREVARFNVYPASHYVAPEGAMKKAIESVKVELKERLDALKSAGKAIEAHRLESRTLFDLEMMEEIGFCKGIENYSRHLAGAEEGDPPATLIDYLPEDALLFVDESHITLPQVGAMFKGDRARKENLVDFGFRLPSALDNRPLNFPEFEVRMPQSVFVTATPADYEKNNSDKTVELVIRPTGIIDPHIEIKPATTQIDDLLEQIKTVTAAGWRVLVTSLTKKMSEQITDFLNEHHVKTRYLHSDVDNIERVEILRDLRKGTFDVLVGINLLREGLDLPEVALVAILDADKEGFLRSERSLIQTIGRAARNPAGRVILYADKITDSMQKAMDETARRRAKQEAHNAATGLKPTIAMSQIKELIDGVFAADTQKTATKKSKDTPRDIIDKALLSEDPAKLGKMITEMEKQMKKAAQDLDFEKAAQLRDQILVLREKALINPE